MERSYYDINEHTARAAKTANSFSDYVTGSATQEYKHYVDCIYDVVEQIAVQKPDLLERAVGMAGRYSRKLAQYYNNYYRNEASCPSMMISGAGNFPVRKKEKQNSRRDTLMSDWEYLKSYAKKIQNLLTMQQPILSGDEKATERLEEKLEKLEAVQTMMKLVNAYYRKNKTLNNCPELTSEQIENLKTAMGESFHYEDKPFMTYELTNNNATIRTTRLRLEKLKKEKEIGTQEQINRYAVDNLWSFPSVYVHCPKCIAAVRTFDNPCKYIFKSPCILLPSAACDKLLYGVKFLLRDYPLVGVGYHFPFFWQLRGAFLAFHTCANPLIAYKVSRIYRAS